MTRVLVCLFLLRLLCVGYCCCCFFFMFDGEMDENNDLERAIFQDGLGYQVNNTYRYICLEPNNVMTSSMGECDDVFRGRKENAPPL